MLQYAAFIKNLQSVVVESTRLNPNSYYCDSSYCPPGDKKRNLSQTDLNPPFSKKARLITQDESGFAAPEVFDSFLLQEPGTRQFDWQNDCLCNDDDDLLSILHQALVIEEKSPASEDRPPHANDSPQAVPQEFVIGDIHDIYSTMPFLPELFHDIIEDNQAAQIVANPEEASALNTQTDPDPLVLCIEPSKSICSAAPQILLPLEERIRSLIPANQSPSANEFAAIINIFFKHARMRSPARPHYYKKNLELKTEIQVFGVTIVGSQEGIIHLRNRKLSIAEGGIKLGLGGDKKCCIGIHVFAGAVKKIADISARKNPSAEIALSRKFNSPHIIPPPLHCYAYMGKNRKKKWRIITELMLGDLRSLQLSLTFNEKVRVMKGALLGLCEMHEKGYIHGDFKALNILVNQAKQGILTDLGLSELERLSVFRKPKTTRFLIPPYDPPKQDQFWDCYAIGVTLLHVFFSVDSSKVMEQQLLTFSGEEHVRYRCIADLIYKTRKILPRWTARQAYDYLEQNFPDIQA